MERDGVPLYVYLAKDESCEHCAEPFEVLQPMSADPLEECPECGAAVEKQVTSAAAHFPKGPAALRNMGMARLEKRSDGNYENVSAQEGGQKTGSLESFGKDLTSGPKKIISD